MVAHRMSLSDIREELDGARWAVVLHSVAFFFIFTGTQTMSTFIATLLKDADLGRLGFMCNALCYALFAVSSLLAPAALAHMNAKTGMLIGGTCYMLYLASFLTPLSEFQAPQCYSLTLSLSH